MGVLLYWIGGIYGKLRYRSVPFTNCRAKAAGRRLFRARRRALSPGFNRVGCHGARAQSGIFHLRGWQQVGAGRKPDEGRSHRFRVSTGCDLAHGDCRAIVARKRCVRSCEGTSDPVLAENNGNARTSRSEFSCCARHLSERVALE